jgi:hypothetical protein
MQSNKLAPKTEIAKFYESKCDTWFTEDETDDAMGIETFLHNDGGISKRCKLKDGRQVVCHSLKGKDSVNIKRITGGDSSKVQDAVTALSTRIDDKPIVIEDLSELWFNDYTKVQMMCSSINFL